MYKSINIIGLRNTYLKEYTIERRAIVITLVMAFIGIGITLVGVGVTDISSNLSFSVVGDSDTILGVSYKFVWNRTKRIKRDGNVIFVKRMLNILSKLFLDGYYFARKNEIPACRFMANYLPIKLVVYRRNSCSWCLGENKVQSENLLRNTNIITSDQEESIK